LFLYSPYAWEAFTTSYAHTPRKVLFQYHPVPDLEARILANDQTRYSDSYASDREAASTSVSLIQREREAWKHADLIICASSFTKRSLVEVGADQARCRVIPYGVQASETPEARPRGSSFQALFVGTGERRKGLHHLLLAWSRAVLPECSTLTIVSRAIDPNIERLAALTPMTKVIRGLTSARLSELYAQSSIFVMPSLLEGFGQVYLEALANGCPVLGTANTGLPDLGSDDDGIYLVEPGEVDALAAKLQQLSSFLPERPEIRQAALSCAKRFTWRKFRESIRSELRMKN